MQQFQGKAVDGERTMLVGTSAMNADEARIRIAGILPAGNWDIKVKLIAPPAYGAPRMRYRPNMDV